MLAGSDLISAAKSENGEEQVSEPLATLSRTRHIRVISTAISPPVVPASLSALSTRRASAERLIKAGTTR